MYCLEVRDPVEKVFTIPELRLIILSYALEDKIEPKKKNYNRFWKDLLDEAWKQLGCICLFILMFMVFSIYDCKIKYLDILYMSSNNNIPIAMIFPLDELTDNLDNIPVAPLVVLDPDGDIEMPDMLNQMEDVEIPDAESGC